MIYIRTNVKTSSITRTFLLSLPLSSNEKVQYLKNKYINNTNKDYTISEDD